MADRPGRGPEEKKGVSTVGIVFAMIFAVIAAGTLDGKPDLVWNLGSVTKLAVAGGVALIGVVLVVGATVRSRR